MDILLKHIATLGFIGYLPKAPGTFGTLLALILLNILQPSTSLHILIVIFIIPIGVLSAQRAEKLMNSRDSKHIVIDEFCGYFFSLILIPFSVGASIAAFFLFRFFDILKPFPIKSIESSLSGGIGIIADDIMAAVYTNIILRAILIVNPRIFSPF